MVAITPDVHALGPGICRSEQTSVRETALKLPAGQTYEQTRSASSPDTKVSLLARAHWARPQDDLDNAELATLGTAERRKRD